MTVTASDATPLKPRPGWVGGTRDVASIVERYAAETERKARIVKDLEALADVDGLAVVIARSSQLSVGIYKRICERTDAAACGVVCGATDQALTLAARTCAASLNGMAGMDRRNLRRLLINPFAGFDVAEHGGAIILGGAATADQIADALRGHHDVVSVIGHSDGLDTNLGDLILCGCRGRLPDETAHRINCVARDYCHRLDVPLSRALLSSRLFDPADLRAHAVVLGSCFGLSLRGSPVPFTLSVLGRMLGSGRVGGMIAPLGSAFLQFRDVSLIEQELARGASLSEALAAFRHCDPAGHSRARLAIIGDPDLRLCPPRMGAADRSSATPRSSDRPANAPGEGLFAGRILRAAGVPDAAPVLAALTDGDAAAQSEARRVLLDAAIGKDAMLSRLWMPPNLALAEPTVHVACEHCGESALRYTVVTGAADQMVRHVESCPICGVTRDQHPDAQRLSLCYEGDRRTFRLIGPRPAGGWAGRLVVDRGTGAPDVWPWPRDPSGAAAPACRIEPGLEPILSYAAVVLSMGSDLQMLRLQVRIDTVATG